MARSFTPIQRIPYETGEVWIKSGGVAPVGFTPFAGLHAFDCEWIGWRKPATDEPSDRADVSIR